MLHETHICGHMKLEVTLAEVKQEKASARTSEGDTSKALELFRQEEDEDRKREERVEERTELHGSFDNMSCAPEIHNFWAVYA